MAEKRILVIDPEGQMTSVTIAVIAEKSIPKGQLMIELGEVEHDIVLISEEALIASAVVTNCLRTSRNMKIYVDATQIDLEEAIRD